MGDDKFNDKIKIKQHYKERIEQLKEELKQDFNFVWIIWQKNNYILPYPTIVIDKPVKNVLVDSYLKEEFLFYQKNQQTLNTEEKTTLYYYVIIPYPQWKFTKPFFKDENNDYLEVNDFYLGNTNEKIWNVVKLTDWTEKIFYNLQRDKGIKIFRFAQFVSRKPLIHPATYPSSHLSIQPLIYPATYPYSLTQ